ncbi:MAG: sensor domain-containing diguanylate cyclase, partial [Nitrospirae bacterium]
LKGQSYLEKLFQENREIEVLLEISFLITSTLDHKEILYLVVKKVAEVIRPDRCSILSLSYASPRYAHVVSTFESKEITNLKLDLKKYPEIKEAIRKKKPVIIKDALKDPLMKPVVEIIKPLGVKSIAVIPVIHRDEVIGAFFLRTSKRKKELRQKEIRFCQSVSNLCANALYNAMLYEKLADEHNKLKKLAITDFLTGVYNIRYFYHRLEEEFSRAQRYGHPLSCIMMDIDFFKSVNDTFGHKTGDMVLREFAQLIKRHSRRSDVFARYGGEEFIMLLPHTPLDGAQKEAERLRGYIREHQFKGLKGQRITASFGVACWPVHRVTSPEELINYADQALFMAKSQGRDRIVVFPQEAQE